MYVLQRVEYVFIYNLKVSKSATYGQFVLVSLSNWNSVLAWFLYKMAVQNMSHNNDKRQVFSGFGLKGTDSDFERKSSNFGLI